MDFGFGLRLEDPSLQWKWAPPRYLPGLRRVEAVATGAIAIRTNHWCKWGKDSPIGPPWELDGGFGYPYGVDGEISLRAWRLGLRVGLVPAAVVGIDFHRQADSIPTA